MPRRRALLLLPLLAGCGGDDAPTAGATLPPGPIEYRHLTPLPLNVATIQLTPTAPAPTREDIGARLRPTPLEAVRTMARDRLVAAGSTGEAAFTVGQAALLQGAGTLQCLLTCRLDIFDAEGQRRGFVEAQAQRSRSGGQAGAPGAAELLLRETMDALNVEFEYQIRRTLKAWLVQASPSETLAPAAVEREDLPRG